MRVPETPEALSALIVDPHAARVFGQPYETADGTTIIPVAKVRSRPGNHELDAPQGLRPIGVFAVKDGRVTWEPAIDATRIALLGVLIGLVAAALAGSSEGLAEVCMEVASLADAAAEELAAA